jgi:serine/threonine protein kinase
MEAQRLQQARRIFEAALDVPAAEREAFLKRECGGDEELLAEVKDLLETREKAGAFLGGNRGGGTETMTMDAVDLVRGVLAGRYQIERELGKGGFGVVYLARDKHLLDRQVVVKVLREKPEGQGWFLKKFRQECEALARIDHPGVVGVLDQGETPDGRHFLVLEYVKGVSLRSLIEPGGMPLKRAANLLRQLGEALAAAHSQGVFHRDLKPENIMVKDMGAGRETAVIIDFGVSAVKESRFEQDSATRVAGSFPYIAPEQLAGQAEASSDTYALAVIAYEMVAGVCPFEPSSPVQLFLQQKEGLRKSIRDFREDVPEPAERILVKALSFEAKDRYSSAAEFSDELACALTCGYWTGEPVPLEPPPQLVVRGRWRRWLKWLAATALAAALVFAVGFLRSWSDQNLVGNAARKSEVSLEYYVMVQKFRAGRPVDQPFRLLGEMLFPSEYHIRLMFSSPEPGYLYLLNEAPTSSQEAPDFNVLFPSAAVKDRSAMLKAGEDIPIPSSKDYFVFDDEQGEEKLWMVWSRQQVQELEGVKKYVNPRDRGRVADDREAATVRDYLEKHTSARPRVEKDEAGKRTILRLEGDLIVNLLRLEHH